MKRPPEFEYSKWYKSLIGTKYEGKCPDLNVDGESYEHEGFISNNPKNAFRNMIKDGLLQSNHLVIDKPNLTERFMKRELYAELGGFDTDYFLYMEDEDICLRSWKLRRPVVYLPTAQMIHNHLRASSKIGKKMFIHMKSMMTFFRKHGLSPKRF